MLLRWCNTKSTQLKSNWHGYTRDLFRRQNFPYILLEGNKKEK